MLVCLNTSDDNSLSFLDDILFEGEVKISAEEFSDQREKQLTVNLNDANAQEDCPDDSKPKAELSLRLCYSEHRFVESMISDLEALCAKEEEYMDYLDGVMNSILFLVVRT